MTKFGDYPSSEQAGPVEAWAIAVPNAGIGASGSANFTIGSFVMPFTGMLIADMKARARWDGYSYIRTHLGPSSPGPSFTTNHARLHEYAVGFGGDVGEIPVLARWDSLAKNTTVTFVMAVQIGPISVVWIAGGGFIRAIPA